MSLDVYLYANHLGIKGTGIYFRENGQVVELTRTQWDERFPGKEPLIAERESDDPTAIFDANITHNLGGMADAAGIYHALWRPDEINITVAAQLIEPLREGLRLLEATPDHFAQFNPDNGWGDYDGLVSFVSKYLRACEEWPSARVEVSR